MLVLWWLQGRCRGQLAQAAAQLDQLAHIKLALLGTLEIWAVWELPVHKDQLAPLA